MRSILLGLALFGAGGLGRALVAWHQGLDHPGGSDPNLWVFGAWNLEVGTDVRVSPLFPALIALFRAGDSQAALVGGWLAGLFGALLPPVTFLLARSFGASRVTSAVAGLLLLGVSSVAVTGLQCQPDSLNVLLCTLATWAAARFLAQPTEPRAALVGVLGALAPLVREHGLVVAAAVGVLLILAPGTAIQRVARFGAFAFAILLAPVVVGQAPGLPWEAPWFERLRLTVDASVPGNLGQALAGLPEAEQERVRAAYAANDRLGLLGFHARTALTSAPWHWGWAVLALALAPLLPGRRGWAAALGILPVLPALLIFSQARHSLPAVPVGLAVAAAVTRPARLRWAVLAGALGLTLGGLPRWAADLEMLRGQQVAMVHLARFGAALCERTHPGSIAVGLNTEALVYCPLPFADLPRNRERLPWHWSAWSFGISPEGPEWREVEVPDAPVQIWRLWPQLPEELRPCHGSRVVDVLAYDVPRSAGDAMDPPCGRLSEEARLILEASTGRRPPKMAPGRDDDPPTE